MRVKDIRGIVWRLRSPTLEVNIKEVEPNPHQPRQEFDEGKLRELADSITESGLLQPIIVRKHGTKYQIVAGERRWRAFRLAGIDRIPVIVKDTSDKKMLLESFVENIQRADLTSIERENAIYELWKSGEFSSQRNLAKALGYVVSTVSELVEAKEFRDRMGVRLPNTVATHAIADTQGLDDATRMKLLQKAETGEIETGYHDAELTEMVRVLKKAPKPLQKALIAGDVEVQRAKEAVQLYEEVERKEGKPIEEDKLVKHVEELKRAGIEDETQRKIRRRQATETLTGQSAPLQEQPRHWADELEQDPPAVQEGGRIKWNLERIDKMAQSLHLPPSFYTTSYSGRDMETFIQLMKAGEVGIVYDIRDTPFSQFRPDFNKEALAKALRNVGIEYKHVPELGVKKEIRDELAKSGDYKAFWKKYDDGLKTKEKADAIEQLGKTFDEAQGEPFALLCTERDPHKCHRHRLALHLAEKWLVESIDL